MNDVWATCHNPSLWSHALIGAECVIITFKYVEFSVSVSICWRCQFCDNNLQKARIIG